MGEAERMPAPRRKGVQQRDLNIPGPGAIPKAQGAAQVTEGDIRAFFATHPHRLVTTLSGKSPTIANITGPISVDEAEKQTFTWIADDKTRVVYYVTFKDQFHATHSAPQGLDKSDPTAIITDADCIVDAVSGNVLVWGV